MKAPKGLLDFKGQAGKMIATIKVGDKDLLEYPYPAPDSPSPFPPAQGNTSTCYVLASPGDILAINILANAGTADVVDVEVDGILRGSKSLATSKGIGVVLIKKVCYRGKISTTGRKEAAKFCEMVVKEWNTKHDIQSSGATVLSAVGSSVLKCWRKVEVVADSQSSDTQATEVDASVSTNIIPNFETHVNWYDVNKHVNKDQTPPPFEIGFINGTLCSKSKGKGKWKGPKERVSDAVARKPGEYKLFAIFVFHLRSAADLISLGYVDVPIRYTPPPLTPKPKKEKALTKGGGDYRLAEIFGDNDQSEAESSQQPKSKFLQESVKKAFVKPIHDHQTLPRSNLQDLPAHIASGHAFHNPVLGIQPSIDQNGHVDSSITSERAVSQLLDNGHDYGDAISRSPSALASSFSLLPTIVEPIELVQKSEQAQVVNRVSKSIPLTNLPDLKGLKGAPARRAWLERAAAQAEDSEPQLFDENPAKDRILSLTQSQQTADSSSFRVPNNSPGHFGHNDSFQNASTVGTPSGPRDGGRISEIKIENSFNDAASNATEIVDPADIALSVQRSARPRADSNATKIVDAAEVDAALRASVRSLGLAGENAASQSPVVAAYHTFPSPVLGSTPLLSFRIRTSNESPTGLAAQQARIYWSGLTEHSQPQLQSRSQSQCQQLSPRGSWPTEGSSTQPFDYRVSTSNQHLQSTSFARQVNHYNELSNARNDPSFGPAFESDLRSGNTKTPAILSVGNMDRFSMPVQDAKNDWLSPFRKEVVVPQLDNLQGNLATKRKSDYMTDAFPEHSTSSSKRMAGSDLAKHGRVKDSNNNNAFTPSKPLGIALGAHVSTPELVEMEQKKATAQARRDAAEKKRKVLQKKLDKALIEEMRREVRELEEQANEIERENAELEARLAVIYAQK